MGKDILNDVEEAERVVCKITLQKYTSLWIDPSDVLGFLQHTWGLIRYSQISQQIIRKKVENGKKYMPFVYFLLGNKRCVTLFWVIL